MELASEGLIVVSKPTDAVVDKVGVAEAEDTVVGCLSMLCFDFKSAR